ncbi:MotB family protein [Rhizobium sp. LjRoot30]|uniref:MotB family protein n=1 Tax=Rhizobium sp. LjRoot30 TaxID=3342320 RepID=UPI003ECC2D2E
MSEGENHHHGKNEIIIVKKHGGDHDGHHGGAWKIAYADFMTAMMAFFLVMWLVNAANEETKASVATYFNPIKLADEKPTEKGLKKPVEQADGEEQNERSKVKADGTTVGAAAATGDDQTAASGEQTNYSEADYFENPYSVLAEIAQEVGQQANVSAKGEGGAADSGPATGADGGEAYRDPFDPDFWTQQVEVSQAQKGLTASDQPESAENKAEQQMIAMANPDQATKDKPDVETADKTKDKQEDHDKTEKADKNGKDKADKQDQADKQDKAEKREQQAAQLHEQLEQALGGTGGKLAEGLVVTPTEGGLLITISDQQDTPMFKIGSAVPQKDMVLAMEKVGKVLGERKGAVLIRGHTDGRQFKGDKMDNWQLSNDRAQSAYYMLVRGGLDEKRVQQISGFADRRLQVPEDPLADANRRIEILLQANQG